ncbi:GNAT family N-acetyltransferase [Scopulibacillus cellulosilyticus]|uniref:GNAT family N-acetyltransferase n=1 Tax=Scopulibacillus cellulosilyticus TaxID=2665665 RepID=A0ABW2PQ96_9BACL
MSDLMIRKAHFHDIPELIDLMNQYIVDFYEYPRPKESGLESLIIDLQNGKIRGTQFVAELDKKLVGFATLYFTMNTLYVKEFVLLHDLFVLPSARRNKVGERLFQTCLDFTRANDFAYMSWDTAKDNTVAQALYDKMGGKHSPWLQYEIE